MGEFRIDDKHSIEYDATTWFLFKNGVKDTSKPLHLFKYYSLNSHNLNALELGYFYLSNPLSFNDPFDCCNNLIIEKQRDAIPGLPTPFINDIPHVGISSFSTECLNPLMWGHYTNSYVGFVLKFRNDFEFSIDKRIESCNLRRVIYSNNPMPSSEEFIFSKDYQFIVKLKDWEYENEWRLVVNKRDNSLDRIFYKIDAIEEVLIGYRSFYPFKNDEDEKLSQRLFELVNEKFKDAKIFVVGPHERDFELYKRKLLMNPRV